MQIARMADASTPVHDIPSGAVVAGYIGGNTPHVWSHEEWDSFGHRKKLPIWVYDHNRSSIADAWAAIRQLYILQVPKGCPVVYDMETSVDLTAVNVFSNILLWAGYPTWVYGSRSTIFRNPARNGRWVADYTGAPHWVPGLKVRAVQWSDATSNKTDYDPSILRIWQYYNVIKAW